MSRSVMTKIIGHRSVGLIGSAKDLVLIANGSVEGYHFLSC